MPTLDTAERLVKLTRELVFIAIAVAIAVMPFLPQLLEQAKGLTLTSAEVAGLRFERAREIEENLETVQEITKAPGLDDKTLIWTRIS